ncbi:DEAD-box ATP-dependent RNA helicase 1-like isoform X2 [Camellia sinensis]|uniref:DEAD-box ATP-dependent RNA helicase 1-like isoform X2 n=1 Tax=Camellia sinensis TaxID=4442 RepID=UPI0010356684|nr:DEAD-box ATP-dependent RNA helicase 1-like isoform X2 [Camellia sinensis]
MEEASEHNKKQSVPVLLWMRSPIDVKEVFAAIAPAVSLSVGLAVGQSSIADEISELIKRPKLEAGICYDPEDLSLDLESSVDILVATPGRLMDHINSTKGFTLEHLCYLVVDETDRLLREAYQSWLPIVLQLIQSSVGSLFPHANTFFPSPFGSLKTRRRSGVERGFKGNSYPRLVKMVLSATLTQDPCKLAQLNLHHPLSLTTGQRRYQLPEQLESFKLVKRFKKLLQKADNNYCPVHSVPSDSIESFRSTYTSVAQSACPLVCAESSCLKSEGQISTLL